MKRPVSTVSCPLLCTECEHASGQCLNFGHARGHTGLSGWEFPQTAFVLLNSLLAGFEPRREQQCNYCFGVGDLSFADALERFGQPHDYELDEFICFPIGFTVDEPRRHKKVYGLVGKSWRRENGGQRLDMVGPASCFLLQLPDRDRKSVE